MALPPLDIAPLHAFWDRQPGQQQGDPESAPIYQAVGNALTVWELAEGKFASLFGRLLAANMYSAERVYGTFGNIGAKKDALAAAAEITFHQKKVGKAFVDYFDLLLKHFVNATPRRNDIAHAIVTSIQIEGTPRGHFLVPPVHATKKVDSRYAIADRADPLNIFGAAYRYTSADITAWTSKFSQLSWWVGNFEINYMFSYQQ